ncbi:hypothetical protein PTKIN_Ptkin16aG0509000 [Pterospermum kingtungense]
MENKYHSMQVIKGEGDFNVGGLEEFMLKTQLSKCGLSYGVVAIMGPQSSGKSTLLNHLFRTNFREMDALQGRNQTTQGIWMEKCEGLEPFIVAMDLEGGDGSERGEDDTAFEKQSALFALAMADIVIINMWCHDVGREQAANKPLLRIVFQAMMSLFKARKTTLQFVLRDKTKTPFHHLENTLRKDTEKIWNSVRSPASHIDAPFREFFKVEVVALSSYEREEMQFKEEVTQLRQQLVTSISEGLAGNRQPVVPASEFSFSAQEIWKSIKENKNLDLPAHKIMVATIRCEEIINQKLLQLWSDENWLALEGDVRSGPGSSFGSKASSILETYFLEYDKETIYFDEGVRSEKRKQLESKALDFVRPVYLKLLEHLHFEALEHFKSKLEHMMNKGVGFAASAESCSDSVMQEFKQACEDAAIRHVNWDTYEVQEKLRQDIQSYISFCDSILSKSKVRCEEGLERLLCKPLECLFESPNQDTWPSVRKLLTSNIETAILVVSDDFSGSELQNENKMLQDLRDYARNVVERKAREAAEKVLHLMRVRYLAFLNSAAVKKRDMKKRINDARTESLRILSLMAVMQLDEKPNQIEDILFSSFMNGEECSKALSSTTWPEVSIKDTLITPIRCNSLWELFEADILQPTIDFVESQVAKGGHTLGITEAVLSALNLAASVAAVLLAIAAL